METKNENNQEGEQRYRILVVDDEKEVLKALSSVITRAAQFNCDVVTAENAQKALQEMENQVFDIVLTDYKMPGMNGVELLREVNSRYPDTVRMLITGYSDLNTAREAINKAEVNNYIEKPWDNEELRLVINAALKRKHEREVMNRRSAENLTDALELVKEFQTDLKTLSAEELLSKKPKIMLEFNSPREFNKFSFEIKKMPNIDIIDTYIFENKYIITVTVYPESVRRVM